MRSAEVSTVRLLTGMPQDDPAKDNARSSNHIQISSTNCYTIYYLPLHHTARKWPAFACTEDKVYFCHVTTAYSRNNKTRIPSGIWSRLYGLLTQQKICAKFCGDRLKNARDIRDRKFVHPEKVDQSSPKIFRG